ncbi:hypothetical protein Tco_0300423 [Tanacetum coccineum]
MQATTYKVPRGKTSFKGRRMILVLSSNGSAANRGKKKLCLPTADLEGGPPGQVPSECGLRSEANMDISAVYGSPHWWFRRRKFYITNNVSLDHGSSQIADAISQCDQCQGLKVIKTKDSSLERSNIGMQPTIYFKEDFTIVPKPKSSCLQETEMIKQKADEGMETRKWSEDDKRRSKDFITAIEKRLQIRRIYRSLESFVGGRIRDIDYRLINRTTTHNILRPNVLNNFEYRSTFLGWRRSEKSKTIEDTYPILLSFTHCGNKSILRVLRIILVILPEHPSETIVFHNEDGNPARANIKQALGYLKDGDGDGNSQPHKGVKASANSDVKYSFTSAQDGESLQDNIRLCLGNDLKKVQDHGQRQVGDLP